MDIQTSRLILREFQIADASFILELLNTPSWLEFIGDRNVHTLDAAEQYLVNGPIRSYRENGFGLCLVQLKEGNIPIGMCGLIRRDGMEYPDIGFAFLPSFASKGYGFEIASATVEYTRRQLKLSAVDAITTAANQASIALLDKLGMLFVREIQLPGSKEPLLLYRLNF